MLLLLDIDGVMVPANPWKAPEILDDGFPAFSLQAVQALNKICAATNTAVWLTTSHKSHYTIAQWLSIFSKRGIILSTINKLPENTRHLNRKDEILDWMAQNPAANQTLVIIDDDKTLNELPTPLKSRLVQTSSGIGLTNHLANMAIQLLQA